MPDRVKDQHYTFNECSVFYLPPDGKVLNYWLVLALFSSEELKNQQKMMLVIWLMIESWPRGLLNKTCNRNSVFVDNEKFDTKRFKTRWTQVQLKNIYAVSFNKLPILVMLFMCLIEKNLATMRGEILA